MLIANKKEVPGEDSAKVRIGVVIRVPVDVRTVGVEVANVDTVTIGIGRNLLIFFLYHRKLRFIFQRIKLPELYSLFSEFNLRAVPNNQ